MLSLVLLLVVFVILHTNISQGKSEKWVVSPILMDDALYVQKQQQAQTKNGDNREMCGN